MSGDGTKIPSFRFVVATRKTEDEGMDLPVLRFLSLVNLSGSFKVDLDIAYGNTDGLPTVYNRSIDLDSRDPHDFIVFIHDDIWPSDVFMFDKISEASKDFDVIGVCGGKGWTQYGDGHTPIIWTHAAKDSGLSGFMAHAADESSSRVRHDAAYRGRSVFSTNYGHSPSRTLTIDGCFMCFTRNAVDSGLRFDENFRFHFYDMDMCFSAYVMKLKVGTAPVLLMHESLGYSVAQPEFLEAQSRFLAKWFGKK